jgi:hypothetical protein
MFFVSPRPFSRYQSHWTSVHTKNNLRFRNAESDQVVAVLRLVAKDASPLPLQGVLAHGLTESLLVGF